MDEATWVDERTVVFPPGVIQFDTRYALRTQAAQELGCPIAQVVLADPVRVAEHDVVPVQACGVSTYYARIETDNASGFLNVGADPLVGGTQATSAQPSSGASLEAGSPDNQVPGDDFDTPAAPGTEAPAEPGATATSVDTPPRDNQPRVNAPIIE